MIIIALRISIYKNFNFLISDKDSNSTTKVFSLFLRSVREGVLWWQCTCWWEVFFVSGLQVPKVFKHSWKLFRKQFSSRWLKPRRKRVSNFSPSGSKLWKIPFSDGWMKDSSFCLNALIVSEFLILGSVEAGKKKT